MRWLISTERENEAGRVGVDQRSLDETLRYLWQRRDKSCELMVWPVVGVSVSTTISLTDSNRPPQIDLASFKAPA